MSHDLHAAWASVEVVRKIKSNPASVFASAPKVENLSVYTTRESRNKWPIADGVISIEEEGDKFYSIALEFKKPAEGTHGILTALGQANAYLHKGFDGTLIILPQKYVSHQNPCEHLKEVIDLTEPDIPIGVFSYVNPDPSLAEPFKNKLTCIRGINLYSGLPRADPTTIQGKSRTQWAHLREGSSDPAAFYNYLKTAKQITNDDLGNIQGPSVNIPDNLLRAVKSLTSIDPLKYLSNSTGDDLHSKIWRNFWFNFIFTEEVMPLWNKDSEGNYVINDTPSKIPLRIGRNKRFFYGRMDSIKNKLVERLNAGSIAVTEALINYIKNVHDRAHSYREDIDSGLDHLGLLHQDGRPSELGYKFVDACDRTSDCHSGTAATLLGAAILKNGQLGAFLHYLYKLSETAFSSTPTRFTSNGSGSMQFNRDEYLNWIEGQLANEMNVMRKVSTRGGVRRKPFQAELAILRSFNFVRGFRIGVGLEINWPQVQEAMDFEL